METTAARGSILVVDDEERICDAVQRALERVGYKLGICTRGSEALERVRIDAPDMVICDINMPEIDGLTLLDHIKEHDPGIPVVMITGYASIESAIDAVKRGAQEYLPKPFSPEQIRLVVERAFERKRLLEQNQYLRNELGAVSGHSVAIGKSKVMEELFQLIATVAKTDSSVLITGESGSGKEVAARLIHYQGKRSLAPFVTVNCSAIPNDLLESELFGHQRGAFTGAMYTKRGSIERASGGTFFLDEIGDMKLDMQAKILRVLEEKRVKKVGSEDEMAVDVRIIAATNKNLAEEIKHGRFREDLYYRLNVVQITPPPLREHKEDIPRFARHFLSRFSAEMKKAPTDFSEEALRLMTSYDWPGNVRELRNAVERAVIFAGPGELVRSGHFPPDLRHKTATAASVRTAAFKNLREMELDYIREVLDACAGNKAAAAEILGISPSTIWRKLQE